MSSFCCLLLGDQEGSATKDAERGLFLLSVWSTCMRVGKVLSKQVDCERSLLGHTLPPGLGAPAPLLQRHTPSVTGSG